MQVLALGGSGAFGSFAVRYLLRLAAVERVVVGCRDLERARPLALADSRIVLRAVDLLDPESLAAAVADCDVVANLAGPAYRYGPRVLDAAIRARRPYVDLCDDAVAAEQLFSRHELAESAGVTAVVGLGCSAGLTNLAAAQASAGLDAVSGIHVVHGAAPSESLGGMANLLHLFDLIDGDIPVLRGGEFVGVPGFSQIEQYDFGHPLGTVACGLISHPEPVMFRRSFPNLGEASVRLGLLPASANDFLRVCAATGLTSDEPVEVAGAAISPREFLATWFVARSAEQLPGLPEGDGPPFAVHVAVEGDQAGDPTRVVFATFEGSGKMTGAPIALGAAWLATGRIDRPGVWGAEACVDADAFLGELSAMGLEGLKPLA